ncbi:P2X purinoceptor 7-like [Saccostrea echinata]|uniref:P2X purinoceptor 7-like n=1 Tax=Saccostrea echinata TaxID=191078 RepID=UPI002A826C81|nr:P2X purinoceptor 7-like [Saccostrea echinata]
MDDQIADIAEIPVRLDIQPYMFEPLPRENPQNQQENSDESEGDEGNDEETRLQNTTWCECGSCEVMRTSIECVCCAEISLTQQICEDCNLECITQHQTFIDNCLNERVLEVSLYNYIQTEGPLDDNEPINEVFRHIAYRRFVLWVWHRLGRGNRKVLPSCVVNKIRDRFSSNSYTGFKYPQPV